MKWLAEPNLIIELIHFKITCLCIIWKKKHVRNSGAVERKGFNVHARSCTRKRQFTFCESFYGERCIVLIVVNNSFDFIWSTDASRRALFGIRFAFKRISRETIAPRHFACAPKEKISLSLQSLAFLILYYINKARTVEFERSFTVFGETEEDDGKRSFAD